jgi:hypothetical protein
MNPFREENDNPVTVAAMVILSILFAAFMLMVALL